MLWQCIMWTRHNTQLDMRCVDTKKWCKGAFLFSVCFLFSGFS